MTGVREAARALNVAARALAATVDTCEKIANDPSYPADRSPHTEVIRDQLIAEALERYRAAEIELTLATSMPESTEQEQL